MTEEIRKTDIEDGYILTDGESEVDYNSMFDPVDSDSKIKYLNSLNKKVIKLTKDNIEYSGNLKKFLLKETEDGKTIITVVFELKK